MIPLSASAEAALDALVIYFARLGRDRAIERLLASVRTACDRYEQQGSTYDAPRPYPALADLGFRWMHEGAYWIAFDTTQDGPLVAGIFHEAADIPNRLG